MSRQPLRSFRIPDELWFAAKAKAGEGSLSAVINSLLSDYVRGAVHVRLDSASE